MATDTIVEEIALNLEEAAQATRRINVTSVSFLLGGIGVGLAVGFYLGHRWNTAQIRAEAFKKSEDEVEVIREVYRQKAVAATNRSRLSKKWSRNEDILRLNSKS